MSKEAIDQISTLNTVRIEINHALKKNLRVFLMLT